MHSCSYSMMLAQTCDKRDQVELHLTTRRLADSPGLLTASGGLGFRVHQLVPEEGQIRNCSHCNFLLVLSFVFSPPSQPRVCQDESTATLARHEAQVALGRLHQGRHSGIYSLDPGHYICLHD